MSVGDGGGSADRGGSADGSESANRGRCVNGGEGANINVDILSQLNKAT